MVKIQKAKKIEILFEKLLSADPYDFPTKGIRLKITCNHGVYIIYNKKGKVVHVGRTLSGKEGLCQRLMNHVHGASSFSQNYIRRKNKNLRRDYYFKFLEVSSAKSRVYLESLSTGLLCPVFIGTGEKLNSR